MKIGIDIQTILGQKTGFGYYVENLLSELHKMADGNEYVGIRPKADIDFSAPRRFVWDQWTVPRLAGKNRIDILHQPAFSAPVFYSKPIVVTVHDLIAVHFGHDIPFWSRQYFGRWMPFSYRFADHIIAISEHTKKDIVTLLGVPEEKISVIYEAADSKFRLISDKSEIERVKKKYKTGDKFLLHIGTLNPRKNLEFIISVFAEVVKKNPEYHLILAGKKGWYYDSLFQKIRDLGLTKKVTVTGYLDEADKVALYNAATLYVFPSLYEGFGLPILEAMQSGTPIIASNRSSIPEIVGHGGVTADPDSIKEWVTVINRLLCSKTDRDKYIQLGLERAKFFSWQKTALQTKKVYEKVYSNAYHH